MSLMNIGFINAGLFWDGRSPNLEDQALHPVENPVEMAEIWDHVEMKIQRHTTYPELFRKAFGISKKSEITKVHVSKALAQFERTLISAKSKFDQYKAGNFDVLNDKELYGSLIYYDDQFSSTVRGHCAHCHDGNHLLTSEVFRNNAITQVSSLHDFPDKGLGAITGKLTDNGVFKAPSLRNIALTAPYMHDGRFQTLEEVIDHYNSGGHYADNVVTGSIQPLGLNQYDKEALKAFLLTMTDTVSLKNPAFLNPFQ
jgi:cytochrome c peroxidase